MRLSVVIPTWCEAQEISCAVRAAQAFADEVVVADAGSPDGTQEIAARAGAKVVIAPKGRGAQLRAGAAAATGDVLLFLHADCRLADQARRAIEDALGDATFLGGNFRVRFDGATLAARFFGWANHVRRKLMRIYYGDSALFVRRAAYEALGGFEALPIFEDYDFVRRLERRGRTAYLEHVEVSTSARRFERAPWRTMAIWTLLQILFSAGVSAGKLARFYADFRLQAANSELPRSERR